MKKPFLKKLKSQAGETLVETLFAILIATFASILLASSTTTAMELNRQARERDAINQLCLQKLATEIEDEIEIVDGAVKVYPMQLDEDGKLEAKTDGDTEIAPISVEVKFTGCKIDEEGTIGDYSTYKLKTTTSGT